MSLEVVVYLPLFVEGIRGVRGVTLQGTIIGAEVLRRRFGRGCSKIYVFFVNSCG